MYRNTLRFCLAPSRDFEEKMQGLLDFCEKAEIDDVMFFIAAEELAVGHITIEEAKRWTDVILRAKKILREKGILISLNPWVTFAHYDGGRALKEGQNFRTMVGMDGQRAQLTVCPLDKNWREYYIQLLSFYVETLQPDILWLEDDFRLTNHEPVSYGCFCEEHLRLFNQKLGTNYDLPTLRKKIFEDEKARRAFIEISAFTIEDTLSFVVSALKKQKTFGLMTSGASGALLEGRNYDKLYSVLAQNGGKPYNRLCLHAYREVGSQEYAWKINAHSMWYRSMASEKALFVSEMENYPHSLYTKSAGFMRYQLLSSAPLCLRGTTLSIFEFNGNGVVNGNAYATVLKEVKPFLSKIDEIGLSPFNAEGVCVLYSEKSSYTIQTDKCEMGALQARDSWWFAYLEMLGIACKYTTEVGVKGQIVAIYGQVLRNYTDEEIVRLFEKNFVLVNATAVEVLLERGLGYLVGAKSAQYWQERTGKYSIEELASEEKILGVSKLRATAQFFCGDYLHIDYENEDRVVYTNMLDMHESVVGDGITRVGNALILPYTGDTKDYTFPLSLICPLREYVIKKAIGEGLWVNGTACFVAEENVCPYVFKKGVKTYILFVNFAEDACSSIRFTINAEYDRIRMFSPEKPDWKTIGFQYEGGQYRIKQPLQARSVVLFACDKTMEE